MNRKRLTILVGSVLAFLAALPLHAQESIDFISSEFTYDSSGSVEVLETIMIQSAGELFKSGIVRTFHLYSIPEAYKSAGWFSKPEVPEKPVYKFELLSVSCDGKAEPYRMVPFKALVRVFVGDHTIPLKPGKHVYVFRYRLGGLARKKDDGSVEFELVNSGKWGLPVKQSLIVLKLPAVIKPEEVAVESRILSYEDKVVEQRKEIQTTKKAPVDGTEYLEYRMELNSELPKGVAVMGTAKIKA